MALRGAAARLHDEAVRLRRYAAAYAAECRATVAHAAWFAARPASATHALNRPEQWAFERDPGAETQARLTAYRARLVRLEAQGRYDGGTELVYVNREPSIGPASD